MSFNPTYKIPKDASFVTVRNQNRMIYSNYLIQQNNVQQGCQLRAELQNGGVADADIVPKLLEGARETTVAQRDAEIASEACPIPVQQPIVIVLRLLILGDSTVDTAKSALTTRFSELGYTNNITITSRQLGTTEAGTDISKSNYDVLLYYTNTSQTGTATLFDQIATFISNGGGFVNAANSWRNYPSNFPSGSFASYNAFMSANSAFTTITGVQQAETGTMNVAVASVITDGLNTAIFSGGSGFRNGNPSAIAGGTKLATYTPSGNSLLAIGTNGSTRLVSLNVYIGSLDTLPNLRNLVANSILYANNLI